MFLQRKENLSLFYFIYKNKKNSEFFVNDLDKIKNRL